MQFVILKPILVAVTLIFYAKGKYKDGNFSPNQSYLYLTITYTISYTMALYALALFYVACKDLLQPFNPVPKFVIIKSVVFLTYWQVNFHTVSETFSSYFNNICMYLLIVLTLPAIDRRKNYFKQCVFLHSEIAGYLIVWLCIWCLLTLKLLSDDMFVYE